MPWLEVHERADEVKTVGGNQRDDNIAERRVGPHKPTNPVSTKHHTRKTPSSLREVLPARRGMRDSKVNRVARTPQRDDRAQTEQDDANRVDPLRALWPVTERADGDDEDEADVEFEEDLEDVLTRAVAQEVERVVGTGGSSRRNQLRCCQFSDTSRQEARRTKKKAR